MYCQKTNKQCENTGCNEVNKFCDHPNYHDLVSELANAKTMEKKLPVKHIGVFMSFCGIPITDGFRTDFGLKQIKEIAKNPQFKNAKPVRLCKRCEKVKIKNPYKRV